MSALACAAHDGCRYQVAWSINPHMVPGSARFDVARAQHAALREAITTAGARVIELPFVCGGYDSVFIKDNAFVFRAQDRKLALMSRLRYPQRDREQAARRQGLVARGFETLQLEPSTCLEGGDLVAAGEHGGLFVGHGFRTSARAAEEITELTGIATCALELVDEHLYHLDTALAVLKDGTAVACRTAFTPEAWDRIKRSPWIGSLIEVTQDEAYAFGCNLVQVGRRVIVGSELPRLADRLAAMGFEPVCTPLTEFQRAGGSAACLVAEVRYYPRLAFDLPAWRESISA